MAAALRPLPLGRHHRSSARSASWPATCVRRAGATSRWSTRRPTWSGSGCPSTTWSRRCSTVASGSPRSPSASSPTTRSGAAVGCEAGQGRGRDPDPEPRECRQGGADGGCCEGERGAAGAASGAGAHPGRPLARSLRGRDVRVRGLHRRGQLRVGLARVLRPAGGRRLRADHPGRPEPGVRRVARRDGGGPATPDPRRLVADLHLVAGDPVARPDRLPGTGVRPGPGDRAGGRGCGDRAGLARPLPVRRPPRGRQPAGRPGDLRHRCGGRSRGRSPAGRPLRAQRQRRTRPSSTCSGRCSRRSVAIGSEGTAVSAPLWVHGVIGVLGAFVVVLSALVLFRPTPDTRTLSADDEARVRTLLRDFGDHDSLGYFATRRDKAVVWDRDDPAEARAGVSYRAFGSISLASGNPVGDPQAWDAAIARWRDHARGAGLSMAVMGAGAGRRRGVRPRGPERLRDRRRGDPRPPRVLPQRARHEAGADRGRAAAAPRLHDARPTHQALDAAGFAELAAAAAQWRGDGGDERGFSMALGRVEDPLDGDCVLVTARDADGALRGFLSFVPWGRNGLSLDLMRRDPTADNGLVELMVVRPGRALGEGRRRTGLAELRDVPRGLRARRRDRGGAGGAAVAAGAAPGQPELAARVALPLQREVPAGLAAAVPLLRVRLRPAPGRHRRRQRRGLPVPSVPVEVPAPRGRRGRRHAGQRHPGVRRQRARADPAARGRRGGGTGVPARCPSRSGYDGRRSTGCGPAASTPTP